MQVGDTVRIKQKYWKEAKNKGITYKASYADPSEAFTLINLNEDLVTIKSTVADKNEFIVPLYWIGPNDIWMDTIEVDNGFIESNGKFNFHEGHFSGGREFANIAEFSNFIGKKVHTTHLAGDSGYSPGRPFKAIIVKEKLEYPIPDCLDSADGTSVHTVMDEEGVRRWVISGYTEGGYCEWSVYLEDLDNFLTEFKKEHNFSE